MFETVFMTGPAVMAASVAGLFLYIIVYRRGNMKARLGKMTCARIFMDSGAFYTFSLLFYGHYALEKPYMTMIGVDGAGFADSHITTAVMIAALESAFGVLAVLEIYNGAPDQ